MKNEAGAEHDLYLDGAIAQDSWFEDDVTPAAFQAELKQHTGDVTVWINSPGGGVFAAAQIYTMLRNHAGKVTVKIHGIAASAASVVAMAGDTTLISPVGMLMIHNPSTMAAGEKKDMEQAIAVLEEVKESILNAYVTKTGLSRNRLAKMMDAETWLNANEAMRLGFVDGILFAEDDLDKKPEEEPEEDVPEEKPEENPDEPDEEPEEEPDEPDDPDKKEPLHRHIRGSAWYSRFWRSWGRAKATRPWTLYSCVHV
ncbi:MAG: head maturation protease, ClpP-related [Ruminococcus sp.]